MVVWGALGPVRSPPYDKWLSYIFVVLIVVVVVVVVSSSSSSSSNFIVPCHTRNGEVAGSTLMVHCNFRLATVANLKYLGFSSADTENG